MLAHFFFFNAAERVQPTVATRAPSQVRRNAAERELEAAVEKAEYTVARAKQEEIAVLTQRMLLISERLKELSASDEQLRNVHMPPHSPSLSP